MFHIEYYNLCSKSSCTLNNKQNIIRGMRETPSKKETRNRSLFPQYNGTSPLAGFLSKQIVKPSQTHRQTSRPSSRKPGLISRTKKNHFILDLGSTSQNCLSSSSSNQMSTFLSKKLNPEVRTMSVTVCLYDKSRVTFQSDTNYNISYLKRYIYTHLYPELKPELFLLTFGDNILEQNSIVGNIGRSSVTLRQQKASLSQTEGINFVSSITDQYTGEKGVAVMPCGHLFSRTKMRHMLYQLAVQEAIQIRCPVIGQSEVQCNRKWHAKDWQLIAGFSQSQMRQFRHFLRTNETESLSSHDSRDMSLFSPLSHMMEDALHSLKPRGIMVQLTEEYHDHLKKKQAYIKIALISSTSAIYHLSRKMTIKQLKEQVSNDHPSGLLPEQIVIVFNQSTLKEDATLAEVSDNYIISLTEKKAEVWELPHIRGSPDAEDPIYLHRGVAYMGCSHPFGREALKDYISSQVSSKEDTIRCPYENETKEKCNYEWAQEELRLVAGLNNSEMKTIQEALSLNWIENNTFECKNCHAKASIVGLKSSRVICPNCNSPNFCRLCGEIWKWPGSTSCKSQCCALRRELINTTEVRQFNLEKSNKEKILVKVPAYRACPRCGMVIGNTKGCKHTKCTCTEMKYSFCFVCLSLYQDNQWKCGSYSSYCGVVAERQVIGQNQ